MMFENRVLKRIYGQRKEEVTGLWKTLRNEEIRNDVKGVREYCKFKM
jgi:hypothetical protein